MSILQPRKFGYGQDGQEGCRRTVVLQGVRTNLPNGYQLCATPWFRSSDLADAAG